MLLGLSVFYLQSQTRAHLIYNLNYIYMETLRPINIKQEGKITNPNNSFFSEKISS